MSDVKGSTQDSSKEEATAKGKSEIYQRFGVLVALVLAVLVPMAKSAALCARLCQLIAVLGAAEWVFSLVNSPVAQSFQEGQVQWLSWLSVCGSILMLLLWFAPTIETVRERVETGCPGHQKTLETMVIVCVVSDSAQLAFGRALGRIRPFPTLSPKKSLEGYIGGIFVTVMYAKFVHGWPWQLSVPVLFAGVVGDLAFSANKRMLKIKDFSGVLGPHGGICDRIDSFVGAWHMLIWLAC